MRDLPEALDARAHPPSLAPPLKAASCSALAVISSREPMTLAQVELADAWRVSVRYILVKDPAKLPACALALIETLRGHYGAS